MCLLNICLNGVVDITKQLILLLSICITGVWAQSLTLHSQIDIPGTFGTDVWGYLDPATGREYAIAGDNSGGGITIVDVSNPDQPFQVANVSTVPGFDIKTWKNYIYTVNGSSGTGGIVDINNINAPSVVGSFPSSHNIFISDGGYLFTEDLFTYNINTAPTSPQLVRNGGFGGHDVAVIGSRLYDFHGSFGTNIYQFDNPANLQQVSVINDPSIAYNHSGWPSEDGNTLFICDELATHPTADITVWDISDLGDPVRIGDFADPNAIVHNFYVIGNYAYVSYYTAGLRIFDVSDPANITIVAQYDTSPLSGETFAGAFGVYPFLPSGLILVNDWTEGLFMFSFGGLTPVEDEATPPASFSLGQNYPNPFNPNTTILYRLPATASVSMQIFDIQGRMVRELFSDEKPAGLHKVLWDGMDARHQPVAAGVYLYRLETAGFSTSKKMLLVR